MNSTMKNQRGMSLVEVLIALGILMLIVAVIMPIFLSGFQNVNNLQSKLAADQLANAQVTMARESSTSCSNLHTFSRTQSTHFDTSLEVSNLTVLCPTTFPALVNFTVSVSKDGDVLSTITTKILVTQ